VSVNEVLEMIILHFHELTFSFFQHVLAVLHHHFILFVSALVNNSLVVLCLVIESLQVELPLEVINAGLMSLDVVGEEAVGEANLIFDD